jgi:hypothetical protein
MEPQMAAQPNQNSLFATTDGHDSDIGNDGVLGLPSRTRNNEGSKEPEKTFNIHIVGMGKRDADEHGPHYRSCATEWGWREDENRPPYK